MNLNLKHVTLALAVASVLSVSADTAAAVIEWGCTPSTQDLSGKPLTKPLTYTAYFSAVREELFDHAAKINCTNPVKLDVGSLVNVPYYLSVTAWHGTAQSEPSSPVLRITSTVDGGPVVAKILLTVGGSVWIASPNYTNFGWKLGSVAGTIPVNQKCDATRKISDKYFMVTSPVTWANGKKDYVVAECVLK